MTKFLSAASCCSLILAAVIGLSAPTAAKAQMPDAPVVGTNYFPDTASAADVATIFYRLTRQNPDFHKWIPFLPEYKTMTDSERLEYLQTKPLEWQQKFDLLTLQDPIAIQFEGVLSPYSDENQGYVVRNFASDTFFSFTFAQKNYAIVPQGLMDHQFLPVQPAAKKDVESGLSMTGRKIFMIIYVQPTYADAAAPPTVIDGKPYQLISGKVMNIALYKIYANKQATVLWEEGTKTFNDNQKNELLNLKQ